MTTIAHFPAVEPSTSHREWWERRSFVVAMILLSAVPLIYPQPAPLVDLLGHIGRYRVQLDVAQLAVPPALLRVRLGADRQSGGRCAGAIARPDPRPRARPSKLIVMAIPALTVAGFLLVAREVHHRLPPTAIFSLPFVYNHPFLFGFVNFSLSMALAFLAFGLWLRLARQGRLQPARDTCSCPSPFIIFFTHTFGWGTLGLLAFSAEAVRLHDGGRSWWRSGLEAALHAAVMALPIIIVLVWRTETTGAMTRDWFEWKLKWEWIYSAVRDRWEWFDIATVAVIPLLLLFAIANPRLTLSRNLVFSVLVLTISFVLLPWTVFGSAYADMRLAPFMIALVPLAIRFRGHTHLGDRARDRLRRRRPFSYFGWPA